MINATIYKNENSVLVSNKGHAIEFVEDTDSVLELLSFFSVKRSDCETKKYLEDSKKNDIFGKLEKYQFIYPQKNISSLFTNYYIVSNSDYGESLETMISRNISNAKIIRQDIDRLEELPYVKVPENYMCILYMPATISLLLRILENYEQYNIRKVIIGFQLHDEYCYTFLHPPVTACPNCFADSLKRNSRLLEYLANDETNRRLLNFTEFENELSIALLVKYIITLNEMKDDNINPSFVGNLVSINFNNSIISKEFILRMHQCTCISKKLEVGFGKLVGKMTGLIKEVEIENLDKSFPPCVLLKCRLPGTKEYVGALDYSWDAAYMRTIGEFIERYCWRYYDTGVITSSWDRIDQTKRLPLHTFNIYDDEQYLYIKEIHKLQSFEEIRWIEVKNLTDNQVFFVPAEFIVSSMSGIEHPLHFVSSTGVSAGCEDFELTVKKAVYELIERDTVTRDVFSCTGFLKIKDINLEKNYDILECKNHGLNAEIYYLENKFNLAVIMCRLVPVDESDLIISYGYACDDNLLNSIQKSLKEALLMREAIIQDLVAVKDKSMFAYNLRNNTNSFFEYIKAIKEVSINELKALQPNKEEIEKVYSQTFYTDITLQNVKEFGFHVVSVWNPKMVDFCFDKNYLPLQIYKDIILNEGVLPF